MFGTLLKPSWVGLGHFRTENAPVKQAWEGGQDIRHFPNLLRLTGSEEAVKRQLFVQSAPFLPRTQPLASDLL